MNCGRARDRQPLPPAALAAVADEALPRPLARRPRLLPHRAAAHGRQRRPAHRRGSAFLGEYTMQLFLGFLGAVATLLSFIVHPVEALGAALARLHRPRRHHPRLHGGGGAALCLLGTFLANLVGRRLIPLNFMRQRYEANFRFSLVRVRENAEGIALYRGEEREGRDAERALRRRLQQRLAACCSPRRSSPSTSRATASSPSSFPLVVTAPRFFAGAITLGVVMQTASAFGQVQSRAVVLHRQLHLARRAARRDGPPQGPAGGDRRQAARRRIDVVPRGGAPTSLPRGLTLALPDGQALLRMRELDLPRGQRDADLGRERLGQEHAVPGAGRHLAVRPGPGEHAGRRARAVPAAEALHPDRHAARRGEVSRRAVDGERRRDRGGAEGRAARPSRRRLDEEAHWSNILSGGEQQRLAVARALVFKPDWLFMDEATASLDDATEAAIYRRSSSGCRRRPWCRSATARRCGNGTTAGSSCSASRARSGGWSR